MDYLSSRIDVNKVLFSQEIVEFEKCPSNNMNSGIRVYDYTYTCNRYDIFIITLLAFHPAVCNNFVIIIWFWERTDS